jgi:hypothetical protein
LSDTAPTGEGRRDEQSGIQNAEQRAIMLQIAQTWMRLGEKEDAAGAAQQQQAPPKDAKTE